MTELQNPSSKSACNKREAEVCQPPIASNRWSLADRDELGEMREGMNPGLLVSQDFLTVDRHLWAAFQQMHKHLEPPGEYCQRIMRRARKTQELSVKKILWLTCLTLSPAMSHYYGEHCDARKFVPFMKQLRQSLKLFMTGLHRNGVSKCKSALDSMYPSVVAFVAEMAALYTNL